MMFMRTPKLSPSFHLLLVLAVLAPALAVPRMARGQSDGSTSVDNAVAVVMVHASDASAGEAGPNAGEFIVRRSGGTNLSLLVFFNVSGTAQGGTDYEALNSTVVIAPGASWARIPVAPIDDTLIESNETVVLRLAPSPLAGPLEQYRIGTPSNAVVLIADNDHPVETNHPPRIELVSPANGAVFPAPANVLLAAHAVDFDGYVATVEFFAGTNSLGITTNNPLSTSAINPFQLTWSNAPAGIHTLTAKATDDAGLMGIASPIRIIVREESLQPVVNVFAADPTATEIPVVPEGQGRPQLFDPAIFTVTRRGGTNIDLPVYYRVSGSASNGVDYTALSGRVTIPAGATAARIEIAAIDDLLAEGTESIVVTLEPIACIAIYPPPPECYLVGPNSRAEAFIHDDDFKGTNNLPPSVRITAPSNGAILAPSPAITIRAVTLDADGYASSVEFFANANKIGEATVFFIREPDPGQPIEFEFQWEHVPAGSYVLTARTRDDDGAIGVSSPVQITVATNRPPTNSVPSVSIVARDSIATEGTNCGWLNPWPLGWERWGVNRGGLNTATFVVRRTGETNRDLVVLYAVAGTASNGEDYEALPEFITIPAGHRTARIEIIPRDDALVEGAESVVLELVPPPYVIPTGAILITNLPPPTLPSPAYWIGSPGRAAALIGDNDRARPPCFKLPDGPFHACLPATNGFCYRIETSTNLLHWVPVCTNVVTDGALHFVDPDAAESPSRFYRAVPEPDLGAD